MGCTITKNISLYLFHHSVVKRVQKEMRFSETQGFSQAIRHIIREYNETCERENNTQGENDE